MTQVKKKEKIKGYLNSIYPTFNQSGDTLTMTIFCDNKKVGEMIFTVKINKGRKITQRVIQMVDCDTQVMIEDISHIVPLKEKDLKILRKEILDYSRDKVDHFLGRSL